MAELPDRYQALLQWLDAAGGQLHPSVEIYWDQVTKASFRVRPSCSLAAGQDIVSLPLSRSLSFLNAIAGHPDWAHVSLPPAITRPLDYLPPEFLHAAPPHVIQRFFLMQQYLCRQHSPWWPYIRTLPAPEHMTDTLPVVWPSDDVAFLAGTNAGVAVSEIRSTLRREYKAAMRLLPDRFRFDYTRPLYYWAYTIFTSRSFRPSLIIPEASLASLLSPPSEIEIDDFSILLPVFDIGNHSPHAATSWTTGEDAEVCTLRSEKGYEEGQQIFNNYGSKTNAELLLGYGFMLPATEDFHNDYVHVKTKASAEAGDLDASHVVSLRPLAHPSSVAARARLLDPEHLNCAPCFSHFQDSFIAALFESIIARRSGDNGTAGADASLTDIMRGKIPEPLLQDIVDALGTKLSIDLDETELHDPAYEPATRNQELALLYRIQCKDVLRQALASLSP